MKEVNAWVSLSANTVMKSMLSDTYVCVHMHMSLKLNGVGFYNQGYVCSDMGVCRYLLSFQNSVVCSSVLSIRCSYYSVDNESCSIQFSCCSYVHVCVCLYCHLSLMCAYL